LAYGTYALYSNTIGNSNVANGISALYKNSTGNSNTAIGQWALISNTTGSNNIAIGQNAGRFLTTGGNNIDIGNAGVAGESAKIRIGTQGTQNGGTFIAGIYNVSEGGTIKPVYINSAGQLGTQPPASARKFKEEIKAMETSEGILKLKPVTFRYKNDEERTPQFGLIAEEVAQVNPDLVVRDKNGDIYTVRYEAVNAMLLNEFLKEHRKVQEQEATIRQLEKDLQATAAHQQKQIEALSIGLQKVSAQLELSKSAPQTVSNNR
jgi:hypothetical protein